MVGHSPVLTHGMELLAMGWKKEAKDCTLLCDGREEFGQTSKAVENDLGLVEPGELLSGPARTQHLCPVDRVEPQRQ